MLTAYLAGLYSVTACSLGQFRKEDGPINHFVAGAVVGAAISSKCELTFIIIYKFCKF